MTAHFWKIACLLLLLILAGCQQSNSTTSEPEVAIADVQFVTPTTMQSQISPTLTPYIFKTSEPGTVTIQSILVVVDPLLTIPDPDTPNPIFLVPLPDQEISTIPSFNVGEVPQAEVDDTTGLFVFQNIPPGKYVVMVIVRGGIQIPAHDYETGNLAVVTIEESDLGQTIKLDAVSIP